MRRSCLFWKPFLFLSSTASFKDCSTLFFQTAFFPLALLSSFSSAHPAVLRCCSSARWCCLRSRRARQRVGVARDLRELHRAAWRKLCCENWNLCSWVHETSVPRQLKELSACIWELLKMLQKSKAEQRLVMQWSVRRYFFAQQMQPRWAGLSEQALSFPTSLPQGRTFWSPICFPAFLWATFSVFFWFVSKIEKLKLNV